MKNRLDQVSVVMGAKCLSWVKFGGVNLPSIFLSFGKTIVWQGVKRIGQTACGLHPRTRLFEFCSADRQVLSGGGR